MKHGVRFWQKKLNRTPFHRQSLLSNLLGQLIKYEKIETTVAKAKFVKYEMEKVFMS
jgi:large subunit ribosomal protein L17